jgi:hypothetical protein
MTSPRPDARTGCPRHLLLLSLCAAFAFFFAPPVRAGEASPPSAAALGEINRIRKGLGIEVSGLEDIGRRQIRIGRPGEEVEGWRWTATEGRWPVDQATFDTRSGLLSKYVDFTSSNRRRSGEAILSMSVVSNKADRYVSLFYPDRELSLESIDRYRVRGKESVYYELRYNFHPQEILFFHPLARMLVNATTGRLYRFELAVDYLDARYPSRKMISAAAAEKIAGLVLRSIDLERYLGGRDKVGAVLSADLYFVRPNSWLGADLRSEGKARAAWVVAFRAGGADQGAVHLVFVDAATGRNLGGIRAEDEP